jgi:type 1 glutamine amidotransferase
MTRPRRLFAALAFAVVSGRGALAEAPPSALRVLVVGSTDPNHSPMVEKAKALFESIAGETGVQLDLTQNGTALTDENLSRYDVVVQLHLAPFDLSTEQQDALQRFILRGKGWVGVHAAGLTGTQFVKSGGYWQWFEDFLGGVVYSPHPALQKGSVVIEDRIHPVTRNLPERFEVVDEWYEFDKSPRPNVHVLGRADESSYHQNKPMGDHPILWTNPKFDRMVYIGIGHDVSMCTDPNFRVLLRDAILWAGRPKAASDRSARSESAAPRFRALVLAEKVPPHASFVDAATTWLEACARRDGFALDVIENTDSIDEALLAKHQVFIQLNFPPYGWKPAAAAAFKAYIEKGQGGWVGFHHATLLGEFDGYPMWPWFWDFMGKIRWKAYIPTFVAGTVHVEDKAHPAMAGVPPAFVVKREEWYAYDQSPRPNVHVLASVDEASYEPASTVRMGDHPVIWTNDHLAARNIYIFMGHGPDLLENEGFTAIFRNSILWAAAR